MYAGFKAGRNIDFQMERKSNQAKRGAKVLFHGSAIGAKDGGGNALVGIFQRNKG